MTEYKSKVKYKPPVELVFDEPIWDEMDRAIEKNVSNINEQVLAASVSACMKVGVKVDKDELIKALRYDRGQYEKGYQDGIRDSAGELQYFKNRVCELCGITRADSGDPNNCELAGHGAWIVRYTTPSSNYKSCTCGICGHERIFRPDEVPKFCEECGSKMAPLILDRKETTNDEV